MQNKLYHTSWETYTVRKSGLFWHILVIYLNFILFHIIGEFH